VKPDECPQFDSCPKVREVFRNLRDEDELLEFQLREKIEKICAECEEGDVH